MKTLREAAGGGLREARLVGRQSERVHQVVHALENFHPCLEPIALPADLLEREEGRNSRRRGIGDHLGDTDLVRGPFPGLVARDGDKSDHVAAVDERYEQAGGEMLVLARWLRDGLVLRVTHRDGPLLADRAAAWRVLRERGIGV